MINEQKVNDALINASENGHTETVKVFLEAGANVHALDDWALRWTSYNGHTETVKVLLEAGADVHALDDWALYYASENGHTETVKVLKAAMGKHTIVIDGKEVKLSKES